MVEVDIAYEGQLRCLATHGPSKTTLLTDAPADNHGLAQSFSPTDLVAAALGTCMLTTMGIVAARDGIDLRGATVHVVKEMATSPTRRIATLSTRINLPARVAEAQRQKLERSALACPVHKSLHPDVKLPVEFNWSLPG